MHSSSVYVQSQWLILSFALHRRKFRMGCQSGSLWSKGAVLSCCCKPFPCYINGRPKIPNLSVFHSSTISFIKKITHQFQRAGSMKSSTIWDCAVLSLFLRLTWLIYIFKNQWRRRQLKHNPDKLPAGCSCLQPTNLQRCLGTPARPEAGSPEAWMEAVSRAEPRQGSGSPGKASEAFASTRLSTSSWPTIPAVWQVCWNSTGWCLCGIWVFYGRL